MYGVPFLVCNECSAKGVFLNHYDLIVAAINDATKKAREMMEKEMSSVTGGLSIPSLF